VVHRVVLDAPAGRRGCLTRETAASNWEGSGEGSGLDGRGRTRGVVVPSMGASGLSESQIPNGGE